MLQDLDGRNAGPAAGNRQTRTGRAWLALVQAGTALLLSARAGAEVPDRIALAYSAPAECPSEDTFRNEVWARASGDWEAQPGELARRIGVTVAQRGERYVAVIDFFNAQGERVTRSVDGSVCDDVVNGIALMTALAIESRVEELPRANASETPQPPATPVRPPPSDATAPGSVRPAPARSTRLRWRFGAAGVVSTGVGPGAALGPSVFAGAEWGAARLDLSGAALWSGQTQTDGVPARFRRLSVLLDGCPVAFGAGILGFEPCAFAEVGSLYGHGETDPALARTAGGAAFWLAPGVLTRLVAQFEPWLVKLEVSGSVPLLRQRFGVVTAAERTATFEVPAFVLGGGLGVGLRL